MALPFIESSDHRRVKLMNDCLQQCDFIDNLSSSLGSTSVVSLVQIQTLQNKYSQLKDQCDEFRLVTVTIERDRQLSYPVEFFSYVQNKTDAFFKKHTVLVKVYCDAKWGHTLFFTALTEIGSMATSLLSRILAIGPFGSLSLVEIIASSSRLCASPQVLAC